MGLARRAGAGSLSDDGTARGVRSTDPNQPPNAQYSPDHGKHWYTLYEGLNLLPGDEVRTDSHTVVAMAFVLGGKVGMNVNSTVEVVGYGSPSDPTSQLVVSEGGATGTFPSKHSDQLDIQTSGGIFGIAESQLGPPPPGPAGDLPTGAGAQAVVVGRVTSLSGSKLIWVQRGRGKLSALHRGSVLHFGDTLVAGPRVTAKLVVFRPRGISPAAALIYERNRDDRAHVVALEPSGNQGRTTITSGAAFPAP